MALYGPSSGGVILQESPLCNWWDKYKLISTGMSTGMHQIEYNHALNNKTDIISYPPKVTLKSDVCSYDNSEINFRIEHRYTKYLTESCGFRYHQYVSFFFVFPNLILL